MKFALQSSLRCARGHKAKAKRLPGSGGGVGGDGAVKIAIYHFVFKRAAGKETKRDETRRNESKPNEMK